MSIATKQTSTNYTHMSHWLGHHIARESCTGRGYRAITHHTIQYIIEMKNNVLASRLTSAPAFVLICVFPHAFRHAFGHLFWHTFDKFWHVFWHVYWHVLWHLFRCLCWHQVRLAFRRSSLDLAWHVFEWSLNMTVLLHILAICVAHLRVSNLTVAVYHTLNLAL